jgi:predicted nucleic acid-binding protein
MNVGYVDTSCLVAVAFGQPGHEAIVARLQAFDLIVSSNLLEAELRAALAREGVSDAGSILGRVSWLLPDRPLGQEIGDVLAAGYLRGADLWHLACALHLSPDPGELTFLTLDQQQAAVAATLGFRVDGSAQAQST